MNYKDSMGRYRTTSLFIELCNDPVKYPPIYTLAEEDTKEGLKSAYQIYINANTEYKAAKALVGSWAAFLALQESPVLASYIELWETERSERLRSVGIEAMILNSTENAAAAKWLAEKKWILKTSKIKTTKLSSNDDNQSNKTFLDGEYRRLTKK